MDCNQIRNARRKHPGVIRGQTHSRSIRRLAATFVLLVSATCTLQASEYRVERDSEDEDKPRLFQRVILYLPNRVVDFVDIWRFNVGVGLGLGINLRPTKGLQAGLAAYDSVRIGVRGRRFPLWHEWSLEGGFDGMYEELGETERGFYEFGGTIHLGLIGLDAAIDIEEILDFGYGVFLSDPAADDFR